MTYTFPTLPHDDDWGDIHEFLTTVINTLADSGVPSMYLPVQNAAGDTMLFRIGLADTEPEEGYHVMGFSPVDEEHHADCPNHPNHKADPGVHKPPEEAQEMINDQIRRLLQRFKPLPAEPAHPYRSIRRQQTLPGFYTVHHTGDIDAHRATGALDLYAQRMERLLSVDPDPRNVPLLEA